MKWIKTEEQRPVDGQKVLYLFDPYGTKVYGCMFIGTYEEECDTVGGRHGFTTMNPEVPYWMPLPEPPNETD